MLRSILAASAGQESLVIEHMHLTDGEELCRYLSNSSKSLQTVRLRNCRVDREVFWQILKILNTSIEQLVVLDLSHTNITQVSSDFFRFVTSTETLKELHLTNSGLSGKEAEALRTLLAEHLALEIVSLEKNDFNVKMGQVLVDAANANPRLKDLRLAGSGVGISNLSRLHDILTKKLFREYPELTTAGVLNVHSGVFTSDAVVEWITTQRDKFSDRVEERRLLALRYEASVVHDVWLAEQSSEKFLALRTTFLADEREILRSINEKIEDLRANDFPIHKRTLETLYKEEALAAMRLEEVDKAKAMEAAEAAVLEAKEKQREELRIQDVDQEDTIEWVVQQELKTIAGLEAEIVDLKRRIIKKHQITHLLFN